MSSVTGEPMSSVMFRCGKVILLAPALMLLSLASVGEVFGVNESSNDALAAACTDGGGWRPRGADDAHYASISKDSFFRVAA